MKKNSKIVYSLNKALTNARSNIIARMDSEDISLENRLEEQFNFLTKNNDVVCVGTQVYFINQKGVIRSKSNFPTDDYSIRKELFLKNNIIIHPTVMFRWSRDLFYREFAYPTEDYYLWLRMAQQGLNEYLLMCRLSPNGISFSNRSLQVKKVDEIHHLLLERLEFNNEVSNHNKFKKNLSNKRSYDSLFQKSTSKVIFHKRKNLKWLFL